jgi:ubiquinone biosynthesis protein UbiJ
MTDRHPTIPPPPDRDRDTDPPPPPTDPAPSKELLDLSDNVFTRLAETDGDLEAVRLELVAINERLRKVDELHALLMGAAPAKPGGKPQPSIVSELHQMNNNLAILGLNTEHAIEQQKSLPELIAERLSTKVTNSVLTLYHGQISDLKEADAAILKRVEELAESLRADIPNGNGPRK